MFHPRKKLSSEDMEAIKTRFCAGESARAIAADFDISPETVRKYSSLHKWPTVTRAKLAQAKPQEYPVTDPAAQLADIWTQRKAEARETIFHGSTNALRRFFAMSPVPQSFAEAKIAKDMLDKAIDPDAENPSVKANINLAVLTQQDFSPRPVQGRTL
jgi:hypothetical protein